MDWTVEIADGFEPEFDAVGDDVQNEILALSRLLQRFYRSLIRRADERLDRHLARLAKEGGP